MTMDKREQDARAPMGTAGAHASGDAREAIAAANRRIAEAIAALPNLDSPAFWPWLLDEDGGGAVPPEALVYVLKRCRERGASANVERAAEALIDRAYPIVEGIVRRTLLSRPQDREDAVRDAIAAMWRYVVEDAPFWERNFVGALNAVTISACRTYLAKKRSYASFADLGGAEGEFDGGRVRDDDAANAQEQLLGRLVFEKALAALDPPLRDIARLVAEGELTQKQIAARVGCTEKTVYNRLARIRDHLGRFYDEESSYEH